MNGDVFFFTAQAPGSHAPSHLAIAAEAVSALYYHRPARHASHHVATFPTTHSRRDPFSVDYGCRPFDDRDYAIACTATNHTTPTCPFGHHSSQRKCVTSLYATAAAAVTAAQQNKAFVGSLRPSRAPSLPSTQSSALIILTASCLKPGKTRCAVSATAALSDDSKLMPDQKLWRCFLPPRQ